MLTKLNGGTELPLSTSDDPEIFITELNLRGRGQLFSVTSEGASLYLQAYHFGPFHPGERTRP